MRALWEAGEAATGQTPSEAVAAVIAQVADLSGLGPSDQAVVAYVAKLTLAPRMLRRTDLAPLRAVGLDDAGIFDVGQVACCFAYMNRLADGTGVLIEPHDRATALAGFDEAAIEAHMEWGAPGP